MLVPAGFGKDIRTFPTPPTSPPVRTKHVSVPEGSKVAPLPTRSRHNSERSGDSMMLLHMSRAEEGGSAVSAVKINYADSVHLASSKTRGEEARA